jgi:hypothetical protein
VDFSSNCSGWGNDNHYTTFAGEEVRYRNRRDVNRGRWGDGEIGRKIIITLPNTQYPIFCFPSLCSLFCAYVEKIIGINRNFSVIYSPQFLLPGEIYNYLK